MSKTLNNNMNKTEYRIFETEIRLSTGGTGNTIVGYASTFNKPSNIIPVGSKGFIEQIAPTAFDNSLQSKSDVMARYNHDDNALLGRTSSGTLRLSKDSNGLKYEVDLPNTSYGNDLRELMQRGDVNKSSFAFRCLDDDWGVDERTGLPLRTVNNCDLIDVAPVNQPAYNSTTSQLRFAIPDSCPSEYRNMIEARDTDVTADDGAGTDADELLLCTCDCPECDENNCEECSNDDCNDINCVHAGDEIPETNAADATNKPTPDEQKYIKNIPGHKNAKGQSAPFVVLQKGTGKILSSHPTKAAALQHYQQMLAAKYGANSKKEAGVETTDAITERLVKLRIECLKNKLS